MHLSLSNYLFSYILSPTSNTAEVKDLLAECANMDQTSDLTHIRILQVGVRNCLPQLNSHLISDGHPPGELNISITDVAIVIFVTKGSRHLPLP